MAKITGTGGVRGTPYPGDESKRHSEPLMKNVRLVQTVAKQIVMEPGRPELKGYSTQIPNKKAAQKEHKVAQAHMLKWHA